MTRPSRTEYDAVVAAALAAIEATRNRPRIRADRSPQGTVAATQAKLAKGEELTEADVAALAAALARMAAAKARGRGRPSGTREDAPLRAVWAAMIAAHGTGLSTYRNGASWHRLTQCDAISKAMVAAGFRTFATYDAVAREMRKFKRSARQISETCAKVTAAWREMEPELRKMESTVRGLVESFAALGPFLKF